MFCGSSGLGEGVSFGLLGGFCLFEGGVFLRGETDFPYLAKTNAEEEQLIAGNACSLCLSDLPTCTSHGRMKCLECH